MEPEVDVLVRVSLCCTRASLDGRASSLQTYAIRGEIVCLRVPRHIHCGVFCAVGIRTNQGLVHTMSSLWRWYQWVGNWQESAHWLFSSAV